MSPPPIVAFAPARPSTAAVRLVAIVGLSAAAFAGGCSSYEYDVVRPTELARHVGADQWETVEREPLRYRLKSAESHLVMEVHNPTDATVQLLGDKSVLVDPSGQSHPLRPQTIAPRSFVKLVLPPLATQVERTGPTIGFGVGLGFGSAYDGRYRGRYGSGLGYDDPYWDEPRYYTVYDPNDATFWRWDGEAGEVRVTLAFDVGGKPVTHEFAFRRKKV